MPIYEYACVDCRRHVEVRQSFFDEPLTVCEHCGGKLRRVIHPVGVVFRGSGFYSTDHRKGKAAEKETASAGEKDGKGGPKAEAKASKPSDVSGSGDASKPAAAKSAPEKSD
ncbi:MAG: FmdB family transcriptional regulator [Actinomycetota bacterium]|nr:FmdB family transcriptional regulator [Actinomycetota bacterium]